MSMNTTMFDPLPERTVAMDLGNDEFCVIVKDGTGDVSFHANRATLIALGEAIAGGVRAAGPLPDDDDDDEDDEDATQPEPEAVALLPETALVDAKGK